MKKTNDGFGLIEILVVLVIIAFIVFKMFNSYYKKPAIDRDTQKVMSEQGIDTTSYSSIKNSVKNTLKNISADRQEDVSATE